MSASIFFSLAFAHFLAVISPGPDFFYVVKTSLQKRLSYALIASFAIGFGVFLHSMFSVYAFRILYQIIPNLYVFIGSLGGMYLLYLGISGLRNKGFTAKSIRDFCGRIGITKKNSEIQFSVLENSIREELNESSPRAFGILKPLKVKIINFDEGERQIEASNGRKLILSNEIFIDEDDFMESPPEKYFRLYPGNTVRLKYACNITCKNVVKNNDGSIDFLECEYDKDSYELTKDKKVKGIIHWLDQKSSVQSVIQNFEGAKKVTYDKAVVEASILNLKKENNCQFERVGYYKINNVNNGSHECYQIVTLKDTSKRKV